MTSLSEIYSAILTGIQNLNILSQSVSASTISSNVGQLEGIIVNGEVVAWPTAASSNAYPYCNFRLASSGYGAMLYNDGTTIHLLGTSSNNSFGGWNSNTPWTYDIATDTVTNSATLTSFSGLTPSSGTAPVQFNSNVEGQGVQVFIGDGSSLAAPFGSTPLEIVTASSYPNDLFYIGKSSAAGSNVQKFALNSSGEIAGKTDGTSGSAGTLGEIQLFVNSSGTTLSVSSAGSLISMGSFTPTAGTYLVWGSVFASVATNPVENITCELRLGSTSGGQLGAASITNTANALGSQTLTITPNVQTLTGSTAIFLMALVAWTGGTPAVTGTGNIQVLRVR